jgi:hypothetical protein
LTLTAGTYAIGAANAATVVITENTPTVAVIGTDASASEIGPDPGTITFTRTGPTGVGLRVHFDRGGTATPGPLADYSGLGTFVDIPPGEASTTVTVLPNLDLPSLDAPAEGDETVVVALGPGPYRIGAPADATVTIHDSRDAVSVTATRPDAAEVDQESGRFTFSRTGSTELPLRVNYVLSGTATPGALADYTFSGANTFVDIPAGQASVDAAVVPNVDMLLEGDETVIVTLTPGQYALGISSAATITIADESATIEAADANAAESGADTATFVIARYGPTTLDRMVEVVFTGSAAIGADYTVVSSDIIGAAGNVRTVRIPAGETTATLTIAPIDDGEVEEAEWVIATVEGTTTDALIAANDSTSITLSLVDTGVIGVARTANVQVSRAQAAPPGGVAVTVTSDDPAVVGVGGLGTLTIPEHAFTGSIPLTGVSPGSTTIRAAAAGHDEGALNIVVTENQLSTPATLNVRPWETASLPITIGPDPAPAGGLLVEVVSAAPALIQVVTPLVTIPPGAFATAAAVRGVASGGATVTVVSAGYVPSTTFVARTADVMESIFSFANGFAAPQIAVQVESSGIPVGAPAPVAVDLSTADAGCLSVPASVTIPSGFVVATFALSYGGSAALPCTTTVTASSGTLGPDTATITVNPPGINMPGDIAVGAGLQASSVAELASSQHGGVTVTISSSDASLVRVSPNSATPGAASIALTIPAGQTSVAYYVQGLENAVGSATVTVTPSAAFPSGSHTVTVVPAAVEIVDLKPTQTALAANDAALYVRTGISGAAGLDLVQQVRAGGPPFLVTLTNNNAAVAQLVSDEPSATGQIVTKQIQPGSFQTQAIASGTLFGLAFDPLAAGSTVVTVTGPPGVVTTALGVRTVTVTDGIAVPGLVSVGSGLQTETAATLNGSAHGGVDVTITSSDPARVRVSPDEATPGTSSIIVTVPAGQTAVPYYVQGIEGTTGAASVTVTLPGGSPTATHAVKVVPSGVEIAALDAATTMLSASDADWRVQVGIPLPDNTALASLQSVRAGGPPFVVSLVNSNAGVAQLTTDEPPAQGQSVTKSIPPGFSSTQPVGPGTLHGLTFDPVTTGMTGVSVTGPPNVVSMAATGARTVVVGDPAVSMAPTFFVGAGLQIAATATLGGSEHGGVDVTIASSAPDLVRVSPDPATPGTGSITVHLVNGTTALPFVVQGMESAIGTTAITVSVAGFIGAQATATVTPIAVQIGGLNPSMAVGASDDTDWWVEVGIPNVSNSALSAVQNVRAGGPVFLVTLTSSAPVAELASDQPVAAGQTVTKEIRPGVFHTEAAAGATAYGLAFNPTAVGSTIVTVTGPTGVGTTSIGARTVNVTP